VLDTIRRPATDGMTMLIVSHEMGFVREVSSKLVLMVDGTILEETNPAELFNRPKTTRAHEFISKILRA
jgi:polar amino acid transport system ATP-binding protein